MNSIQCKQQMKKDYRYIHDWFEAQLPPIRSANSMIFIDMFIFKLVLGNTNTTYTRLHNVFAFFNCRNDDYHGLYGSLLRWIGDNETLIQFRML